MKMITLSKKNILALVIIVLMVAIILSPGEYIAFVFGGLIIYAKNVLPALFPFIFFTKMLTCLNIAPDISRAFARPTHALFGAPPITSYIMTMGALCGYPIGAKLTNTFYEQGYLTTQDINHILPITNNAGPIFVIGTAGTLLLGNKWYGYVILLCHLIASFILGLIYRQKSSTSTSLALVPQKSEQDILSSSMTDSVLSILCVGGYIAIVCVVIKFVDKLGILGGICQLGSYIGIPKSLSRGLIVGVLEMTCGITSLSSGALGAVYTIPIATFIVSFGGLCIHLQSMSYLSKCGVKYSRFLLVKLAQALLASIIAIPFAFIFV